MERYQNGKIYKIVCNITGKVYIGSTCKKLLSQRLVQHRADFKGWKDGKRHNISSFEILEGNDYYIELLENVCCNSKDELLIKERFYIKNNDCVNKCKNLNMTEEDQKQHQKEYYENNKDTIKEWHKENYENNKDKIKEHQKEYYENNKDKIKEYAKEYSKKYYEINKDKKKEYHENNKDNIKTRQKEYREKNKDKKKEYQKKYRENKKLLNNSL
jgi:hypothetical protein